MLWVRVRHDQRMRQHGFTLIELLVTISIIGILAAIAAVGVSKFRTRAVKQSCYNDVRSVQLALDTYRTKYRVYPTGPNATTLLTDPSIGGVLPPRGGALEDSADYDITLVLTSSTYSMNVKKIRTDITTPLASSATKLEIETACAK